MKCGYWNVSSDLPENLFLRLRLDATGRIAGIQERPEFTGTSGIGIYRYVPEFIDEIHLVETHWSNLAKRKPQYTT